MSRIEIDPRARRLCAAVLIVWCVQGLSCATTPDSPNAPGPGIALPSAAPEEKPSAVASPVAAPVVVVSTVPEGDEAPPPPGQGQAQLSVVVREGRTGLTLEADATQRRERANAQDLVGFLSHHLGPRARVAMIDGCRAQSLPDPYCQLVLAEEEREPHHFSKIHHRRGGENLRELRRRLIQARLSELGGYTEVEVVSALQGLHDISFLGKLIDSSISSPQCPPSSLLTGLGMKAEEQFPEPKYRDMAIALYKRSFDCGSRSSDHTQYSSSIRAGYRLGLLYAWSKRWKEVEPVMARVSESDDVLDFKSRALFWRFQAARQLEDVGLQEMLKNRLVREHPLSLHGLIAGGGASLGSFSIVHDEDPIVWFRSQKKPELNVVIRAAEALQLVGAHETSFEVLEPILERLKGSEEPFQLYVANLLNVSGETIHKFQLLANLFHDNPALISKASLEMLYPLRRFELIRQFETEIDPYLVISLIRQESAFNERARSPAGALGLMQLMPVTARRMEAVRKGDLFNAATNLRLGVRLFSRLLARYDGDAEYALAAYNAGADRVDQWRRRYPTGNMLLFVDLIPFRETREYVAAIARNYYWYLRLYSTDTLSTRLAADRLPAGEPVGHPCPAATNHPGIVEKTPMTPECRARLAQVPPFGLFRSSSGMDAAGPVTSPR